MAPVPGHEGGCEPLRGAEELKPLLRVGRAGFMWQAARGAVFVTRWLGAGSGSSVSAAGDLSGNTALRKPDFSQKLNLLWMRFHVIG